MPREAHTRRFDSVFERYLPQGARCRSVQWMPVEHTMMWGEPIAIPAACRCDRRLTEPHAEPTCPYIDPDSWYAAEVERMRERAPA